MSALAYTLDNAYPQALESTATPGVLPRNRRSAVPHLRYVEPGNRDLVFSQGRVPYMIEYRGNYDMGHWTLYWTSQRGGWAVRCTVDGTPTAPAGSPQFALFSRVHDCKHPNMTCTEHSSTYRTTSCPDCGYSSSHDSGD